MSVFYNHVAALPDDGLLSALRDTSPTVSPLSLVSTSSFTSEFSDLWPVGIPASDFSSLCMQQQITEFKAGISPFVLRADAFKDHAPLFMDNATTSSFTSPRQACHAARRMLNAHEAILNSCSRNHVPLRLNITGRGPINMPDSEISYMACRDDYRSQKVALVLEDWILHLPSDGDAENFSTYGYAAPDSQAPIPFGACSDPIDTSCETPPLTTSSDGGPLKEETLVPVSGCLSPTLMKHLPKLSGAPISTAESEAPLESFSNQEVSDCVSDSIDRSPREQRQEGLYEDDSDDEGFGDGSEELNQPHGYNMTSLIAHQYKLVRTTASSYNYMVSINLSSRDLPCLSFSDEVDFTRGFVPLEEMKKDPKYQIPRRFKSNYEFSHRGPRRTLISREKKHIRYHLRMNLFELLEVLGLTRYNILLTKEIEWNVLQAFARVCKFPLGYKTWIRDVKREQRVRLLTKLHCFMRKWYPELDMEMLEAIVKRGTYGLMQSRLRRERRKHKEKQRS